jgi:hypothetical protein
MTCMTNVDFSLIEQECTELRLESSRLSQVVSSLIAVHDDKWMEVAEARDVLFTRYISLSNQLIDARLNKALFIA